MRRTFFYLFVLLLKLVLAVAVATPISLWCHSNALKCTPGCPAAMNFSISLGLKQPLIPHTSLCDCTRKSFSISLLVFWSRSLSFQAISLMICFVRVHEVIIATWTCSCFLPQHKPRVHPQHKPLKITTSYCYA